MNVGYIYTNDKIKYGKSNYKIISFTKNIYEKPLIVSYNGKLKDKIIIVFDILQDYNEYIKCTIINVIGNLEESNLFITLKYIYFIYRKKIYNTYFNNYEINILRKKNSCETIFSIDPDNCIDIDDAISYNIINKNKFIISIYIAQPICFISEELLLNRAKTAFSTLYDKNILHLWGDNITYSSSFIKNESRNAICIEFNIDNNEICDIKHYNCTITCDINTTYNKCYNYDIIKEFINITNNIVNNVKKINIDSHECIEYWMIQVNKYIGNLKINNIPYRITKKKYNLKDYENINDSNIDTIFKNKIFNSAYYDYKDNLENNDLYHESLNLYHYTHFTSPIRRIIDTIIHWCIVYNIDFKELLTKYNIELEHINNLNKATNKYHKDLKLLDFINNNLKDGQNMQLYGYVFNLNDNIITVYFEEIGFKKVKLWDKNFYYLIDEKKIKNILYGNKYNFNIKYKKDFLPRMRLFITAIDIDINKEY